MKKLLYVFTGLCLLAGIFTCCEKNPLEETGGSNGDGTTPGGTTPTEQTGTLKGTVTDKETGLPLELALVELVPSEKKTVTDQNGEFGFAELLPGNYALKVSKLGYKTVESGAIVVKAEETVRQEVAMEKEQTDLRIVNDKNEDIEELEVRQGEKISFKILNAGTNILEWDIPVVAAEWVKGFSKESGKLSPGASENIEVSCTISFDETEAVVYIMSNGGNKQLKLLQIIDAEKDFGIKMVAVEGGTFKMGATLDQLSEADDDEKPVHSVLLDNFYIGKYEVTVAQWRAVMLSNFEEGDYGNYPAFGVSWNKAVEFCERLSRVTGKTYRLPTEAEWEYAARGGQHADGTKYAGSNTIGNVAWYDGNYDNQYHPVGQKMSNGLGLYDMSGNVYEWCSDWYGDYSSSPVVNPQGPETGTYRVCRGGSLGYGAVYCRVSWRGALEPDNSGNLLGFRVVCSAE